MADSSRNPGDNADLNRLERELRGMRGELEATRREAEEAVKAEEQAASRLGDQREQLKKEREAGEQAARRAPQPRETEQAAAKTASAAEQKAAAEVEAAKAVDRQQIGINRFAQGRLAATGAAERSAAAEIQAANAVEKQRIAIQGLARQRLAAGGAVGQYPQPLGPPTGPGREYSLARGPVPEPQVYGPGAAARARTEAQRVTREQTLRVASGFQRVPPEVEAATAAERGFTASLRASAAALGLNAQQMERHGALTTEFIAAAARGEVTIRDLGTQVGLTIGKFAGWTIAATAVYGAVGALSAVGRGAIAAASGVDLVARALPAAAQQSDHLQQQFAELSTQFNLPVEDVTQAVYGMTKVFGSQGGLPAALKASQQALFAMKVGELDSATATRALTGIVGGFKLEASDLPAVFDTINQAQNKFGGNTGQLVLGMAKAAGAFRLVGGSYRQLTALIEAGTRVTGRTGEEIGTAISRSAGVVLTQAGQARLRQAKLDPTLPYMQLLAQAASKARGQTPERVQEIARALVPSGGQFARVFVPLLQNRDLYDRIFREISPEKSRGSAARELATALRQPNEELAKVGNHLEQIGVQLSRAGAFDIFLVSLRTANKFLEVVERLLNVFNELPKPLRQAAVILLQIGAALRLARRFDVGALLPGAAGRLLASTPSQRLRRETQIYLGEQRAAFVQQRQSVRGKAFAANLALEDLQPGTAAYAQQKKVVGALEKQRARLEEEIATIDEQLVVVNKQIRGAAARDLAATEALLAEHAIPATAAQRLTGVPGRPAAATAREAEAAAASGLAGGIPRGADLGTRGITGTSARGRARAAGAIQREEVALKEAAAESQKLGRLGARMPFALKTAETAATVAGRTMSAGANAVRGLSAGLEALMVGAGAMLGPIDILIASAIAIPFVLDHFKDEQKKLDKLAKSSFHNNPAEARARATEYRQKADGLLATAQESVAATANFFLKGSPVGSFAEVDRANARLFEATARNIEGEHKRGFSLGTQTIVDRYTVALKKTIGQPVEEIKAARRAIHSLEIGHALTASDASPTERNRAKRLIQGYREDILYLEAQRADARRAVEEIKDIPGLKTYIDLASAEAQGGIHPARGRNKLAQTIYRARELVAEGRGTLSDALAAIDSANQGIVESITTELNRGLRTAGVGQAGRLRSSAIASLRRQILGGSRRRIAELRASRDDLDKSIDRINQQLSETMDDPATFRSENVQGSAAARLAGLRRVRARLLKDRRTTRGQIRGITAQMKAEQDIVNSFADEQNRAQFQSELEEFDSGTALAQAQTNDPVGQARVLAQRLHERTQKVRDGYRRHLQSLADVQNAEAREAESLRSLASERFADFQSRQQLAASVFELSHLGDQGAILRNNVSQAAQGLANAKLLGLTPAQMRSANDAMIQAQIAYGNYRQEQAKAMSEATTAYQLSLTDDPVKQTAIQLQGAIRDLRFAKTPAERLQGQANINNLRREHRNARYQDRFDTIEFEAEMGKITKDTEISRLQSLLKIIKGNREFRRQIALRIHQLKTEQDDANKVELNVGDIRLPSVYDVRRLAKLGTANELNVHQNFHFQIDGSGDPEKTADHVFNRFHQRSRAGMRSAARTRGG